MELVNPYTEQEDCKQCATHGLPCLKCADAEHGTKGPGYLHGVRTLPLVNLDPNICRTMMYWWNAHPTEPVSLLQTKLPDVELVENMFDVNVSALGMLGRTHVPTLRTDHNLLTMFFNSHVEQTF